MILTITYRGENTQDLGYLLHKNPYRPQSFDLPAGKAHVFYPEITDEKTTCAMIMELDPLLLSRGKPGTGESGLFDYVNDRPYAASSFMCRAMSRCFGTAMSGKCDRRQELADSELDLEADICSLPVRGDKDLVQRLFLPLGYEVSFETFPVDEDFPEWGESPYVRLRLRARKRLSQILNQIYVLIPVFDLQIHHFVSEPDVDNVLKHGGGWLEDHPERKTILRRYFRMAGSLAALALEKLSAGEDQRQGAAGTPEREDGHKDPSGMRAVKEKQGHEDGGKIPLDRLRLEAVAEEVLSSGARSVIDIGCGEGKLLAMLAKESRIEKLTGTDVSVSALDKAKKRTDHEITAERQKEKLTLFQGSVLYQDVRFSGYDAACLVEVVEHIDPEKLPVLEEVLFGKAAPGTVIVTTPDRSFNERYGMGADQLRHKDHRFEWSGEEFRDWCERTGRRYGYSVRYRGIGGEDGTEGCPTQMGVFSK